MRCLISTTAIERLYHRCAQVDHRLYETVLASSRLEALKLALVSFEEDILQKALDNLKQVTFLFP